jgi:hypothetical protein
MAAFVNQLDLEITLRVQPSETGSAAFQWSHTSQPHNNEPNQVRQTCLYFRSHQPKVVECRENTLCLPQGISRQAYSLYFHDVESCSGASSRQSR